MKSKLKVNFSFILHPSSFILPKDRAMPQVCKQCSHVNPDEASFCHHDGAILASHGARGPINAGSQPFPNQFVFPTGQVCRNFDQLAMTCQQNWPQAVDALKQGFLAQFLGGLGRVDLAMAAKEAADFPEADRGLDQFLGRLPSQVLEGPKLKVEPREVSLGQLKMGADHHFDLQLTNLGMRLLYGSVSADCKWLTLGEAPGSQEKLFQFHGEMTTPVQVRVQFVRAGTKPLEGQLVVDSNGGPVAVKVRVEVPITPFTEGVLAGSQTPRQIAEKAKANPGGAAPLFEKGAVADWFKKNGWIYPVQGPSVYGLGAVQQFFEALGLAKAPKVEVPTRAIDLRGEVGQALQSTIEVRTSEKKPVFAYATCNQPWVDVSKVKLDGRRAAIPVVVTVPNQGGMLKAEITVTGNGNQKFKVPLTLTVEGSNAFADFGAGGIAPPGAGPAADFADFQEPAAAASGPAETSQAKETTGAASAPAAPLLGTGTDSGRIAAQVGAAHSRRQQLPMNRAHLLPALLLVLTLIGFLVRALAYKPDTGGDIDRTQRLSLGFGANTLSWGLEAIDPHDPKNSQRKKLTRDAFGASNSTLLRIDGKDLQFGKAITGKWEEPPKKLSGRPGMTGTWKFFELVLAKQTVDIVPGQTVEVAPGEFMRLLDTCMVRYRLENHDGKQTHKVGLRILLDTYIGSNDGAPFVIPGQPGLVDTFKDLKAEEMPDFIQVQENPDLQNPGVVAQLNLKLGSKLEPPARVSLTRFPGPQALGKWDIELKPMRDPLFKEDAGDSAVVLYWEEKDLPAGEVRNLGFSYSLGRVTTSGGGKLGLSLGGSFTPGGELTVVALVPDPQPNQTLTLELPKELQLVKPSATTQPVPDAVKGADGKPRASPVTWRVRSTVPGSFSITVQSKNPDLVQTRRVNIKPSEIF